MSHSSQLRKAEVLPNQDLRGFLGEATLSFYAAAGHLAAPLAGALLRWREWHGREDGSRRGERFGIAGCRRPSGPLVWIHAASVGETISALPLIGRLSARVPTVLLTTGTVTAAQIAERRLGRGAIHQFMPLDIPSAIDRFLDHWRPSLALFAESEIWPTTLRALGRRGLPLAVINARLSERSFRSWRVFGPFARSVFRRAELFLAQTLDDAARLQLLGARRVVVCGNMKFDVPPPPADSATVACLRQAIGDRFVLVAASTHAGEETAVLAAHSEIAGSGARLLTILAPRHPERGDLLAAEIGATGLTLSRRSQGEPIRHDTDIYLADTIGEMGLWYRLADFAFLGGSIVPHGGQNPIEPAKLQIPVLHGVHVGNFRDVYDALAAAGAVETVHDSGSLAAAVKRLIEEPRERARLAREAHACIERFTGALDRTLEALDPYLVAVCRDHEAAASA